VTLLRRLVSLGAASASEASSLERGGILTLADLEIALDDGRIERLVEAEVVPRLQAACATIANEAPLLTLGRSLDFAERLIAAINATDPRIEALVPSGDLRRFEPIVTEVVLVGRSPDPPSSLQAVCAMDGIDSVLHCSGRRAILRIQQLEVDVRIVAADEYGTVLYLTTGSRSHVKAMTALKGRPRLLAREEDIYTQAGLAYIPPETRQATGELEAATYGRFPTLVTRADIRGDLHMHTNYSDGADSLDTMVAAAFALGYEYIAITDHSERAGASRTVARSDLARQREAIEKLREAYPSKTILHGIEVDIMPDGSLDFDDEALMSLDIVLASLHDPARQDPATLTRRCLRAIQHPLVNVITHPANRLVGKRSGYELDFPAVYAAAAQTGTALEVDGAPGHLDLDGEHAREAVAAGVTVTIDSDCHRARLLDRQMRLGIGTARRGWVQPQQVLNTRPIAEVKAFIAAKRGRLNV
jgi:DNA polymerase (family 10)